MPVPAAKTVGVIGSGTDEHDELASEIGLLVAELRANLLTGGGAGVMTSVSRAFTRAPRAAGVCIGIVPCRSERDRATPKPGYPNPFVELAIYTHLPRHDAFPVSRTFARFWRGFSRRDGRRNFVRRASQRRAPRDRAWPRRQG